jgi:hypothetical protein
VRFFGKFLRNGKVKEVMPEDIKIFGR